MRTIQTKAKNRKPIIIAGTTVAVLAALTAAAFFTHVWPFNTTAPQNGDDIAPTNTINYDPPTQDEVNASQNAKDRIKEETDKEANEQPASPQKNATQSTKKQVSVGVSYADVINDSLEIRAFSSTLISGDGTCTATVTKGSETITKATPAFVDATSTICRPVYIPTSQLSQGTWRVVVSYTSSTHEGTSGTVEVEVK